jgi:hypothetical protein
MAEYLVEVQKMEKFFYGFEVRYVPRLDNRDVDHLAWIASSRAPIPSNVNIEKLTKPSIKEVEPLREADLMIIDGAEQQPEIDWMSPIKAYLDNQPISDEVGAAVGSISAVFPSCASVSSSESLRMMILPSPGNSRM